VPPRIPDDKRALILTDIRSGDKALRQIARDHHISPGTVANIARENGETGAFERTSTKRATEAKVADNRARRAELSQRFLDEAQWFLEQLHRPHTVFNIGGKDNVYTEHTMAQPPTTDLRNLIVSAATAYDKHLAQDRHDAGGNVNEVTGLLSALFGKLQAEHGPAPE
jgi:transposase-like protein